MIRLSPVPEHRREVVARTNSRFLGASLLGMTIEEGGTESV
jgi:hypothetical protein